MQKYKISEYCTVWLNVDHETIIFTFNISSELIPVFKQTRDRLEKRSFS